MQSDTTPITAESAVAALLAEYPKGLSINEGGVILGAGPIEKITDLSRLAEIASEPKELSFEFHGATVSVKLRGLTSEEAARLDAMEEPRPPTKLKPKADAQGRKLPEVEEFDWQDPVFRRKSQDLFEIKRAIIIATALVGIQVPGNTPQEQRDNLKKMFPPQLLELLREKVMSLTSDPITIASFI